MLLKSEDQKYFRNDYIKSELICYQCIGVIHMELIKKRLVGLAFLLIFLMIWVPPMVLNEKNKDSEPNIDRNIENRNPSPSTYYVHINQVKINGTALYEDGTYYCFRGDTIAFNISTSADVSALNMTLKHPTTSGDDFAPFTFSYSGGYWIYSLSIPINKPVARYNGTIGISNGTSHAFFRLNISVNNPNPKILRAVLNDTKYLGAPHTKDIIEGETYLTYQSAQLGLEIWVANRDGLSLLSTPYVSYENGKKNVWTTRSFVYIEETTLMGQPVRRYYMSGTINMSMGNQSLDAQLNWSTDSYIFRIITEDTEGKNFSFEFNVYVANSPPIITEFIGLGDIDTKASSHTFNITFNGTDSESDTLFGSNLYNFTYTTLPSSAEPSGNFAWKWSSEINQTINRTLGFNEMSHDLVVNASGYGYYMNFGFSKDFCFEDSNIASYFKISYYINASTSLTLTLDFYNYVSSSWVTIGTMGVNVGIISAPFVFFISPNQLKNFINYSQGNTLLTRIGSNGAGDVYVNHANIEFKILRRASFSNIMLDVYHPNDILPRESIDINNHYSMDYNGIANRWAFRYFVNSNSSDFGLYKFVIRVYDWGLISPSQLDTTQIGNGSNLISDVSFLPNDKTRSYATQTLYLRYGITATEALRLNRINVNASTLDNQDLNVTLVLDDNSGVTQNVVNVSLSPEFREIGIFPGNTWTEGGDVFNKKYILRESGIFYNTTLESFILNKSDTSSILADDPTAMRYWDNDTFRFHLSPEGTTYYYAGFVLPFYLDAKPWLGKENITEIRLNMSQWYNFTGVPTVSSVRVQFWDFKNEVWVTPNEGNYSEAATWIETPPGILAKRFNDVANFSKLWNSSSWNITDGKLNIIRNCIDENNRNQMLMRVLYQNTVEPQNNKLNISIDFVKLLVFYNNTHNAWLKYRFNDGKTEQMVNMTLGVNTATRKEYYAIIPTKTLSASTMNFDFFAQNGNHTLRLFGGQFIGRFSWQTGVIESIPFYNQTLPQNDINKNYTVQIVPRYADFINVNYLFNTNLHRHQDYFMFNATVSHPFPLTTHKLMVLQLRQADMATQAEWMQIDCISNASTEPYPFKYNETTGQLVANFYFTNNFQGNVWRSGLYYYRILVVDNVSSYNATPWQEHNYQPQQFEIQNLESGNYYRVTDNVNYKIYFVDLEADNDYYTATGSEFQVKVYMTIYDRYEGKTIYWDSNSYYRYDRVERVNPALHRFPFNGYFNFSKNVNIGTYNNIVFQVWDLDPDWPQVGTLELKDYSFTVLNHAPQVQTALATNTSNNEVYRDNWVKVSTLISDIDDYFNDIQPTAWTLSWINSTGGYQIRDITQEYVRTNVSERALFEFTFFVDIRNKTGIWPMVANFRDWDGATLSGPQTLNVQIKNNLPILKNMFLKNLDTGEIAYLGNQTDFGIYRNNATVQIITEIYDVEDTRISELQYSIANMRFELVNTFNPGVYNSTSFVFSQQTNGSRGYFLQGTWENNTYLPSRNELIDNPATLGQDIAIIGSNEINNIKFQDGLNHSVLFIRSPGVTGGDYITYMEGLPISFQRNELNALVNLSIRYQTNGTSTLYLLNRTSNEYVAMGVSGMLNSATMTTLNISLTPQQISHFIKDSANNELKIKINSTSLTSNTNLIIDFIRLDYRQLNNYKYEVWVAETKIPNTKEFKAGDLSVRVIMTDHDGGIGTDQSNILNVLNHAPEFVGEKFWIEIKDAQIKPIYTEPVRYQYSLSQGYPYLDFYVNAIDKDGIELGVTYITLKGRIQYDGVAIPNSWFKTFEAQGQLNDSSNQELFLIKVDIDPRVNPEFTRMIKLYIDSVEISDADFGYVDVTRFECASILSQVQIVIEFTGTPPQSINVLLITLLSIGGAVGAVIFGYWFYRSKISWRKYLSKDD